MAADIADALGNASQIEQGRQSRRVPFPAVSAHRFFRITQKKSRPNSGFHAFTAKGANAVSRGVALNAQGCHAIPFRRFYASISLSTSTIDTFRRKLIGGTNSSCRMPSILGQIDALCERFQIHGMDNQEARREFCMLREAAVTLLVVKIMSIFR